MPTRHSPPHLSVAFVDWRPTGQLDTVVIGSGYGGAVAALRLAQAGQNVVVLERGSEYLPGDFPNDVAHLPKHLRAPAVRGAGVMGSPNGLFDWHVGLGVVSLTANGLGGGSLINAGVTLASDLDVRQQSEWPAALRHDLDAPDFSLRYATNLALASLGARKWQTAKPLAKTNALARLAPFMRDGAKARPLAMTINPERCTSCGDCATGCNVEGAKLTLRDTYLAKAVRAGAQMVCGATAYQLSPGPGGLWALRVLSTDRLGHYANPASAASSADARLLLAKRVIVAAGTFGSTELLQRSRELADGSFTLSPALGTRFSGNGDSLSFIVDKPEALHSEGHGAVAGAEPVGPTITQVVDLRRQTPLAGGDRRGQKLPLQERLIVQDGATPGAIARAAQEMLATAYTLGELGHFAARTPLHSLTSKFDPLASGAMAKHTQVLLTMGHDGSAGRIVRVPERDTSVPFWQGDPAAAITYKAQDHVFARTQAAGGVHLHPPTWQLLPAAATQLMSGPPPARSLLTVHPLGGCPMADQFDDGVVDDRGRVWRANGELWPGLFVLDGSIVPTSLGVNPLLTITALAERAMAYLVSELRVDLSIVNKPPEHDHPQTGRGGTAPSAPRAPQPFDKPAQAPINAALFERLTCAPTGFHSADGRPWFAELRLEMGSEDWLKTWNLRQHKVEIRDGRLRLQAGARAMHVNGAIGEEKPATLDYDIQSGWFELLPAAPPLARFFTPFQRGPGWWFKKPPNLAFRWLFALDDAARNLRYFLRMVSWRADLPLSWLALRGMEDVRRNAHASGLAQGGHVNRLTRNVKYVISLLRNLSHAEERRTMRYQLRLQRQGTGGNTPEHLLLVGTKNIGYGANWWQLLRWAWLHARSAWAGKGVPAPRPALLTQLTDPYITLLPYADTKTPPRWWRIALAHQVAKWAPQLSGPLVRAWGHGQFQVDEAQLLAQAPLLLRSGDLTSGQQALAAYPLQFLRHALKTHLFDFRAPDYADQPPLDGCGPGEVVMVHGTPIWPRAHDITVRRGRSEGEPHDKGYANNLRLRLWHYTRTNTDSKLLVQDHWYGHPVWRARSVLLLHAFGQSGAMFTLPSVQPNMAAQLLAEGFDVWILEHRISVRLPYTDWPSTIDQIARWDVPGAVDFILADLQKNANPALPVDAKLQIFSFAQCIGGAALAMSLLDGQLSHGVPAESPEGGLQGLPVLMPKLAGAVISQTHPFLVGSALTRAKTWVPGLLRNVLGAGSVPLSVRQPMAGNAASVLDRIFASLPVPDDERCPQERNPRHAQDDCATCRRIRFIEAPLFRHANLSDETHADLPRLFGNANLHLFAHAALCVENERLVDHDGRCVYVHDERIRTHWGLPLAFLHGERNELFDVASARRSAAQAARLFPQEAQRVEDALQGASQGAAWIVKGFGHVDVVIGRNAPEQVFRPMAQMFSALWLHADTLGAPPIQLLATARAPRAGPWLGHVAAASGNALRVHLAFVIDDRYSEGKEGALGPARKGRRTWAWVRVGRGHHCPVQPLAIEVFQPTPQGVPGYRVTSGVVELNIPNDQDEPIEIVLRCFSVHEALAHRDAPPGAEYLPLHSSLDGESEALLPSAPGLAQWCQKLVLERLRATQRASRRIDRLDPAWRSISVQRRQARDAVRATARLSSSVIQALLKANRSSRGDGRTDAKTDDAITFAAACCRYPGMAVDGDMVDSSARELAAWSRGERGAPARPAFALLLGDQIYADATGGMADSKNAVELYTTRHMTAMSRATRNAMGRRKHALGDLLASLPVYLTQDDHEFSDGWPGKGAIEAGQEAGRARDQRMVSVAKSGVRAFQQLHMPDPPAGLPPDAGSYTFTQGCVRFFVLDTRGERQAAPRQRIVSPQTLQALDQWFQSGEAANHLNCIVSGSVLLPRLAPGNNPANPGEDSMAWCPSDRDALLNLVSRWGKDTQPRRFLLLSGDYHVSAALALNVGHRALGAALVVPPLYSSLAYTNATREALWMNEDLKAHDMSLLPIDSWDGSGFAAVRAERHGAAGYRITLTQWLQDHAVGAQQGAVVGPVSILLD